jgi:multiple sugar transport system permease protein
MLGAPRPAGPAAAAVNRRVFLGASAAALGSVVIVLPTALVFVLLQKQSVGGLTLGANKG